MSPNYLPRADASKKVCKESWMKAQYETALDVFRMLPDPRVERTRILIVYRLAVLPLRAAQSTEFPS